MKTLKLLSVAWLVFFAADLSAQEKKQERAPGSRRGSVAASRKDSEAIRSAFKPVVAEARKSIVKIKVEDKVIGLGTIIGPDGWIVTKASLITGDPVCQLDDGKDLKAKIVGVDEKDDLAVLKVDATNLKAAEMANKYDVKPGQWAVSAGNSELPIAIGVVSGPVRQIIPGAEVRRPMLGVLLQDMEDQGVLVMSVTPGGGAAKAGMKAQDVILEVGGIKLSSQEHLREQLSINDIGASIVLKIRRGKELLEVKATLGDSTVLQLPGAAGRGNDRQAQMNLSAGKLSERRSSFQKAFQHDSVIRPEDCGGPVLNLEGKVIGINISRSGRTESFAIPVDHLRAQMFRLMSGEMAPKPIAKKADAKPENKDKEKTPAAPAKTP